MIEITIGIGVILGLAAVLLFVVAVVISVLQKRQILKNEHLAHNRISRRIESINRLLDDNNY